MKKAIVLVLVALIAMTTVFAQAAEEVKSDKVQIRVLNYIDMSEPNSANEIEQIWNKFEELHPEIELVREDLFNEPFHNKVEAYAAQGNLPNVMLCMAKRKIHDPPHRRLPLQPQGSPQERWTS